MKTDIKSIKNNIRRNYARDMFRFWWATVLLLIILAVEVAALMHNYTSELYVKILIFVFMLITVPFLFKRIFVFLKNFIYVIKPEISPTYKSYDLPSLLNQIEKEKVFENDYVAISNLYIVSKWDNRKVLETDKIMAVGLYHTIHRESQISYRDEYLMCFYDVYGKETRFYTIGENTMKTVTDSVDVLQSLNPKIKYGSTKEIIEYVKENKIEKNG